jgi:hypothetical protein
MAGKNAAVISNQDLGALPQLILVGALGARRIGHPRPKVFSRRVVELGTSVDAIDTDRSQQVALAGLHRAYLADSLAPSRPAIPSASVADVVAVP